jgi:hypothetical protein
MSKFGDYEERPLRQEDYQVMAEELRRQKVENELLKKKLAKSPFPWKKIMMAIGLGAAIVFAGTMIAALIATAVESCERDERTRAEFERLHPKPLEAVQKYPCYFVRHNLTDDSGEPWQPFHVYKSMYAGGGNEYVNMATDQSFTQKDFKTEKEAWEWAQSWHLEMCR